MKTKGLPIKKLKPKDMFLHKTFGKGEYKGVEFECTILMPTHSPMLHYKGERYVLHMKDIIEAMLETVEDAHEEKYDDEPRVRVNYSILPGHMRGGMQKYIEDGIRPGDFLLAVLRNDLVGAAKLADEINLRRLHDFAEFLYNEAPIACWGNKEAIDEWIEQGGLNGEET